MGIVHSCARQAQAVVEPGVVHQGDYENLPTWEQAGRYLTEGA
jgi:hypothetical protein